MRKFEKISLQQWIQDGFDTSSYDNIKIPKRATLKSAGYDFYAPIDIKIEPHFQKMIPSGLKVIMEDDDVMLIIIRSSLGIKKHISIANQVGVIDSDYYNNEDNEGHIWICLQNNSDNTFIINQGDKISQALFIKYNMVENDEVIEEKRVGGFGSTNKGV